MKQKIDAFVVLFGLVLILSGCSKIEILTPIVNTVDVTSVTEMTAVAGGIISTDNGRIITARGVCWSTSPNPTIADYKLVSNVDSRDSYTCNLTGLNPITTYYVRAFATNAGGTAYGEQVTFTTKSFELTTIPPTFITATTAISGGLVSFDNDRPDATSRGVCWNEFPNPTALNNKTLDGVGKGSFTSSITGLKPNTTYYVRAYITSSEGTRYGNEQNFTTLVGVPKACFECVSNVGFKVSFSNCSDYPISCLWDFGDGTTSTEKTPTHSYNSVGTYIVKLVVSNDGLTDFVTKTVVISDIVNISNAPIEWYNGLIGKYIDVDRDGNNDFFVFGYSHTGPSQTYFEKSIMPLGNYGIVCDSINVNFWNSNNNPPNYISKVHIPKRFSLGNTILNSEETTTTKISFSASYRSYSSMYSFNSWDKDEVSYVGYISKAGNISKMGWIKLNLFNTSSLYSLKMPSVESSLLIDN